MSADRLFLFLGALSAAIAVAAGAVGAHALQSTLTPERLAVFETAVRYQTYHAIGMCVVAWAVVRFEGRAAPLAVGVAARYGASFAHVEAAVSMAAAIAKNASPRFTRTPCP